MELLPPEEQEHRLDAAVGAIKTLIARIPILDAIIGGCEAYSSSRFEHYVRNFLATLKDKVADLENFLSDEWIKTPDGQQFCRKVVDAALDAQLEEKHLLFAQALINGVKSPTLPQVRKLLFIDMVRHLSLNALMVLGAIHERYAKHVISSTGTRPIMEGSPQFSVNTLVDNLSGQFHPYDIECAIEELKASGLFSKNSAWRLHNRRWHSHSHLAAESASMFYTEFSAEFASFISGSQSE